MVTIKIILTNRPKQFKLQALTAEKCELAKLTLILWIKSEVIYLWPVLGFGIAIHSFRPFSRISA
jgi:hypothetical protein